MKQLSQANHIILLVLLALLSFGVVKAQSQDKETVIDFPDIPGYQTLLSDFHMHSVFSDGQVWPSIRVQEATRDGFDAISLTDHLEYQPYQNDIPHEDRNRSYEIAMNAAKNKNLLVINGAEITREMPPGHLNAIFLNDANKLIQDDVIEVCREAKKQGAFIFWNHPNWIAQKPNGVAELSDMHHQLLKEGLIDGIEITNEHSYSEQAFQIGLDHHLTLMGSSDIHGIIDWEYEEKKGQHRPATLVFAEEKSEESLKNGLEEGRTVVWFKNTLFGEAEYLIPLIEASLIVRNTEAMSSYKGESKVFAIHIENISALDLILENTSDYSFYSHPDIITIKAHQTMILQVKTLEALSAFDLKFKVLNAYVTPLEHADISIKIDAEITTEMNK